MKLTIKSISIIIVLMIIVIASIIFFSFNDDSSDNPSSEKQSPLSSELKNQTPFPETNLNNQDAENLLKKCNLSFNNCKTNLRYLIDNATVLIKKERFFDEFQIANDFFSQNKGENQETLRRELSSFNTGDPDELFPIVLYSVTLKGTGGEKDLVIVCNSFGDIEQYSKNWLLC